MSPSSKETQRQTLLHLWNEGIRDASELHSRTHIPLSTIYYNINKLEKNGSVNHKRGNGRPRKITANVSRAISQYVRRDSSMSGKSIAAKLAENGVELHHTTITKHLAKKGYKNSLPLRTPMLTSTHKENRVAWARRHLNDNWKKTIFTDETAFQLFSNTIKRWYKNTRPVRLMPKDRRKIFAWGGFCIKGKTSLFCFRGIMDSKLYVEIVERHLPEVNRMLRKKWRFQQDNDPKHTSRMAKNFFKENVPEIMDWPSNSPDLNPIENLWAIVKRETERRMPKNLNELERIMVEEWNAIPVSVLINLVDSMKRRCEEVIVKNGERISY